MPGKEYHDLADLLLNNERAKNFYKDLPDEIQQNISHHGEQIRSMTALRHFAATSEITKQ